MVLYFIVLGLGNSINGSINQQKVTRAYLFARIKNNPYVPQKSSHEPSWSRFGMEMTGFRINEFVAGSESPEGACYSTPLAGGSDDIDCAENYKDIATKFIRVFTVYGLCGQTYQQESGVISFSVNNYDPGACLIE